MNRTDSGPASKLAGQNGESALPRSAPVRRPIELAKLEVGGDALRALPAEFAKRHLVLPFNLHNGSIDIATAEPGNARVIDDIRLLTGLEVREFEVPGDELQEK